MSRNDEVTLSTWAVVALTAVLVAGISAAARCSFGCKTLEQMQPPRDPLATVDASIRAQRICAEAVQVCAECDAAPVLDAGLDCMTLCLAATADCTAAGRDLAEMLREVDGGT